MAINIAAFSSAVIKSITGRGEKADDLAQSPAAALKEELRELTQALCGAYSSFDLSSDPQMVEACVLEIKALEARYGFVLRELRRL